MTRIVALNVGHQTWARPVPAQVLAALLDQQPDIGPPHDARALDALVGASP